MTEPLHVYAFQDGEGGAHICIARRSSLKRYISKDEIDKAFSGHVSYHQPLWKLYLGVWGRRNGSRFRRFLRERGAELILHHEEPPLLTHVSSVTHKERTRVRTLPERQT